MHPGSGWALVDTLCLSFPPSARRNLGCVSLYRGLDLTVGLGTRFSGSASKVETSTCFRFRRWPLGEEYQFHKGRFRSFRGALCFLDSAGVVASSLERFGRILGGGEEVTRGGQNKNVGVPPAGIKTLGARNTASHVAKAWFSREAFRF